MGSLNLHIIQKDRTIEYHQRTQNRNHQLKIRVDDGEANLVKTEHNANYSADDSVWIFTWHTRGMEKCSLKLFASFVQTNKAFDWNCDDIERESKMFYLRGFPEVRSSWCFFHFELSFATLSIKYKPMITKIPGWTSWCVIYSQLASLCSHSLIHWANSNLH